MHHYCLVRVHNFISYCILHTVDRYILYMIPVTVYYPEAKALLFERARAILNKDKKWKSTKRKINNIIKCLNIFSLRFIIKQTSFDVARVERLPSINSKCKTVHFKKWSLEDTREFREFRKNVFWMIDSWSGWLVITSKIVWSGVCEW